MKEKGSRIYFIVLGLLVLFLWFGSGYIVGHSAALDELVKKKYETQTATTQNDNSSEQQFAEYIERILNTGTINMTIQQWTGAGQKINEYSIYWEKSK